MKKIMLLLLLLLGGCHEQSENKFEGQTVLPKQEEGATKPDDNKQTNEVIIEIPEQFVSVDMTNNLSEYVTQNNISRGDIQDDHSIRLIMSKQTHEQLLADMQSDIIEQLDEIVANTEVPSIRRVYYNDAFTEFDITIEPSEYKESFDSFIVFTTMSDVALLKVFENNEVSELRVNYIDVVTGEILNSEVYFESE